MGKLSATRTRRDFLRASAATAALATAGRAAPAEPVRVVVWDEQQPAQKPTYDNFLGNWIADHLKTRPGLTVQSVNIGDTEKGLSPPVLRDCDVLIWWGHQRQAEITPEVGRAVVERIKEGTLSLVALHSAHWATPFVESMYELARVSTAKTTGQTTGEKVEFTYVDPPRRYTVPKADARPTPFVTQRKFPGGTTKATVHLPLCCFPEYRADGKPSTIRVLKPDHPIARGVPKEFTLPQTEMYNEPFHVPEPDEVVLEERWATGEWFRSGMVWKVGAGRVFYFRPGHETFPVYKEKPVLQILENAVRWLGAK
ncbi:ThuA domain-containing protein [Fimbriiglobus ruber]|uniref:Trehalose utilization protein n=1 Tax=Fimbriiglobus ruber TaxID=1908690 RepID=A0A225DI28_9BACT|nr:ThuA domain-containing protein [Fimbriiglobus ruber]OWK39344.1 trehalose utilization protein [Fimbriiglobus ruber]